MRQLVNSDATTSRTFSPLKSTLTLSQRRKSSDAATEESVKSKVRLQMKLGQPLKMTYITNPSTTMKQFSHISSSDNISSNHCNNQYSTVDTSELGMNKVQQKYA